MTLPEEFAKMFPPMSQELIDLLTELDGIPDDVAHLMAVIDLVPDLAVRVAAMSADLAALTARVTKLEGTTPPPEPVPDLDTVHVGAPIKTNSVNIGWAVIQKTDLGAATAKILDQCCTAKKMHLGPGFGPSSPIQEFAGGPIDFSYHDKIYGLPGKPGYFGTTGLRVLTAYSCPPYMRQPKVPGLAPMPNPVDMGLYAECPPHWSHHEDYAILIAAFVDRYQIDVLEDRNEWKGEATGNTTVAGSVMVPPGSGLPGAGPATNRWAMEHHTDCWNHIVKHVRAVRPECKLAMGYMVARTLLDPVADAANGPFPMLLKGDWGYADKKAMRAMMYMIANAVDFDYLCLDVKTSANNTTGIPGGITPENQWAGLQKVLDWEQWFNDLADYEPPRYGRAKNRPTWYAEAYSRVPEGLNADNHPEAVATDAWAIANYIFRSRAVGWMRWQTEGNRTASADPAIAHSIALVNALGSVKSLQPTEAVPVYAGLVEHFPPGTQLYNVTVDNPSGAAPMLSGIASDTTLCIVSRSFIERTLTFKGEPLVLAPYDVKFVPR